MALNTFIQKTVSPGTAIEVAAAATREQITIVNMGPDIAYLGDAIGVTAATGFPLLPLFGPGPDALKVIQDTSADAWFAIAATDDVADVRAIQSA